MVSEHQQSFAVTDNTELLQAVMLALAHFECGTGKPQALLPQYETFLRPDFTLVYRGFEIPVSVDDTAGTLEARVRAYLGLRMRAAA
jgi:hypothetical protein